MTPDQSRAARAWLNWSQGALAKSANVALSTVSHFEAGKREPTKEHLAAMKAALQRGGISFLDAEKSRGIAVLK
jgi:transcriptional regulator with XRE-family HTH domain